MDAVVTAGGIPQPNEPLYEYSKGGSKALIDIAGKPMIQWVLDALSEAKTIERVVVIGLSAKLNLTCKKPLTYMSNQGKMLENLKAGTAKVMELNPKAKYVLFVSSDIPSITGEMVDWVVNTCAETKDDLYYNVVRREDMEARFPGSKRTYTPLKELEVCGGDMNVVRASIVNQNSEFWNKLIEARKNPAAQAALIGPDIIFKFIFRQLTIDNVIQRVADKLGLKGRAIVCPFAEVGMDVDKPHQLDLMRADLQKRARKAAKVLKPAIGKPVTKSKPAKTAADSKAKPAGKIKRK
ncbi:MAG: nucleotidyltransferase family protein [Chloroflexi bacterium]|nr:nucleotidyltransferase family protein [Chloroflexota bacterium]